MSPMHFKNTTSWGAGGGGGAELKLKLKYFRRIFIFESEITALNFLLFPNKMSR